MGVVVAPGHEHGLCNLRHSFKFRLKTHYSFMFQAFTFLSFTKCINENVSFYIVIIGHFMIILTISIHTLEKYTFI